MAIKELEKKDKYEDYRYQIVTPEELREANWLIEQGDYKDMEDYINRITRVEISIMKDADAKKMKALKKRRLAAKKRKKERNNKIAYFFHSPFFRFCCGEPTASTLTFPLREPVVFSSVVCVLISAFGYCFLNCSETLFAAFPNPPPSG